MHTYDGLNEDGTIKPAPWLLAFDRVFGDGDKLRFEVPNDPRPRPPEPPPSPQMNMFTPTQS
jgi:hypothetical protein